MTQVGSSILEGLLEFDPATLFEAAGQRGMVDPGIRPAWAGAKIGGVIFTAECPPKDNLMLHHAVAAAPPGFVIVANIGSYMLAGAWGEILTTAAQARGVGGLAVDGAVRDIDAIAERGFPVFSRGLAIGACTKERFGSLNEPVYFGGLIVRPGDIIVGNTDGIVIVPSERAGEVYENALRRRANEARIMKEIENGKTTVEVLGLPGFPRTGNGQQ